jgi:hypothetical protein
MALLAAESRTLPLTHLWCAHRWVCVSESVRPRRVDEAHVAAQRVERREQTVRVAEENELETT